MRVFQRSVSQRNVTQRKSFYATADAASSQRHLRLLAVLPQIEMTSSGAARLLFRVRYKSPSFPVSPISSFIFPFLPPFPGALPFKSS